MKKLYVAMAMAILLPATGMACDTWQCGINQAYHDIIDQQNYDSDLQERLDKDNNHSNIGVSGAMAMSSIENARPGKAVFGMGYGYFNSTNAIAVGIGKSFITDTDYVSDISVNLSGFYGQANGSGDYNRVGGVATSVNFHF